MGRLTYAATFYVKRPMQSDRGPGYQPDMVATSHVLLWILAALLAAALLALGRKILLLRARGLSFAIPPGSADTLPLISAPTLAGDTITIGGASRDGRPVLLLFVHADCAASAQALRVAATLCDPARLRLILLGDGDATAYGELVRPYRIRPADMILHPGIGAEIGTGAWPAGLLMTGDGAVLGRGAVHEPEQLEALLALLPTVPAGNDARQRGQCSG